MSNTVVVTGGTGYIGSSLLERLVENEYFVRATNYRNDTTIDANCLSWFNVGRIDHDTDWSSVLNGVDTVVHTAGLAHVAERQQDADIAYHVNCLGTANLAEQAAASRVRRFIFLSTVQVLGDESGAVAFDEHSPRNPASAYARSKAEAEVLLESLKQRCDMEIIIIRPTLVYGATSKGNFPKLVRLVNTGLPLPFAGIRNSRSMIFIDNLVDFLMVCVAHAECLSTSFLVSDGRDVSTPELIDIISKACDKNTSLFSLPDSVLRLLGALTGASGTVRKLTGSLIVDSSHCRKRLDWEPRHLTEESIAKSVRAIVDLKAAS